MHRQLRVPRNFLAVDGAESVTAPTGDTPQISETAPLIYGDDPAFMEIPVLRGYLTLNIRHLKIWGFVTCVLHLFATILIGGLYAAQKTSTPTSRVQRAAVCWSPDMTITNHIDSNPSRGMDRIDSIALLIGSFFALSFMFQLWAVWQKDYGINIQQNRPQFFRYIEYSVSASLMMISIFMSFGLLDSYLHVCVFFLTFLCMIMGLAADVVRDMVGSNSPVDSSTAKQLRGVAWSLHYISWVPMLVPWFILVTAVSDIGGSFFGETCHAIDNTIKPDDGKLPDFVLVIVTVEWFLFAIFGVVQRQQFSDQFHFSLFSWENGVIWNHSFLEPNTRYKPEITGFHTEFKFLTLSLISKYTLGMLIFSQVLIA